MASTQEQIENYISSLEFKKKNFGGVDAEDVLEKFRGMVLLYNNRIAELQEEIRKASDASSPADSSRISEMQERITALANETNRISATAEELRRTNAVLTEENAALKDRSADLELEAQELRSALNTARAAQANVLFGQQEEKKAEELAYREETERLHGLMESIEKTKEDIFNTTTKEATEEAARLAEENRLLRERNGVLEQRIAERSRSMQEALAAVIRQAGTLQDEIAALPEEVPAGDLPEEEPAEAEAESAEETQGPAEEIPAEDLPEGEAAEEIPAEEY